MMRLIKKILYDCLPFDRFVPKLRHARMSGVLWRDGQRRDSSKDYDFERGSNLRFYVFLLSVIQAIFLTDIG